MKKHYWMKRKKGQLIIFGVLIFPVIFLCLAMVINVGMVVHDKINLQNSVDLAAIYAAQKQAEVMDAMAHINYQMRQSYKLFAWRYLVLGNIGGFVDKGSNSGGYNILDQSPSNRAVCPKAANDCNIMSDCITEANQRICPYAVCTVHPLFSTTWYEDNTHICQNYRDEDTSARQLPPLTTQVGVFDTLSTLLGNNRVQALREELGKNCSTVGFQNWLVAASMFFAFLDDQEKRKKFVEEKLFPLLQNAQDIEGEEILEGVRQTIKKNLTYVNYKKFDSNRLTVKLVKSGTPPQEVYPGLSAINFTDFFEWDKITPVPFYVQNINNANANASGAGISQSDSTFCETTVQSIFQCRPHDPSLSRYLTANAEVLPEAMRDIERYKPQGVSETWCNILKTAWDNLDNRVVGFYKKNSAPNLGVKIKIEIPYKGQLFFPFFDSDVMYLKAVAYAKAFGASFGSSYPKDERIPRNGNGGIPNYSVKDLDQFGLANEEIQWAWNYLFMDGRNVGVGDDHMRNTSEGHGRTFDNYSDLPQNVWISQDPMVLHYENLGGTVGSNTVNVNLVQREIFTKPMRVYEEMAIAPDQFDLKYYTILPNYMLTLYPKLKKAVRGGYVPADLGHVQIQNIKPTEIPQSREYYENALSGIPERKDLNPKFRLNYIERQIIYANTVPMANPFSSLGLPAVFITNQNGYKATSIDDLLTSWVPNEDGMYVPPSNLQKCEVTDQNVRLTFTGSADPFLTDRPDDPQHRKVLPSHCLKGGRTGFSVKLIDPAAL